MGTFDAWNIVRVFSMLVLDIWNLNQSFANRGGTKEKKKSRFPCTICGEDHPTHRCPKKDEIHCYLVQQ
jgi:hypothetical protein